MKLAKPQITSVSSEMHATIGQQVTLRLSFSGTPQPIVAWTFKGRPIDEDPSVELSADGSLVIVCVEQRHAGRYMYAVSCTSQCIACCNHVDTINHSLSLIVYMQCSYFAIICIVLKFTQTLPCMLYMGHYCNSIRYCRQ